MLGGRLFEVDQQQSGHHPRSQVTMEAFSTQCNSQCIKLAKGKKNTDNNNNSAAPYFYSNIFLLSKLDVVPQ